MDFDTSALQYRLAKISTVILSPTSKAYVQYSGRTRHSKSGAFTSVRAQNGEMTGKEMHFLSARGQIDEYRLNQEVSMT